MPNYLGGKNYQAAKNCFELRDRLAHGKTTQESIVVEIADDSDCDRVANEIIAIKSIPFQQISHQLLKMFIDTAREIEKDIEANGFYPQPEGNLSNKKVKLSECPLSVSGIRVW